MPAYYVTNRVRTADGTFIAQPTTDGSVTLLRSDHANDASYAN